MSDISVEGSCPNCGWKGSVTLVACGYPHEPSPVSPAPVTNRAADEHDDRPGARCQREPGRSASTT